MKEITNDLLGKSIKCGEEWYSGVVYYIDIYKNEDNFQAKRKIYFNTYTKVIEKEQLDTEIFVPFGFEIIDGNFNDFNI